jgi:outer membrane protein assembly factor BamE
MRYFSTLRYLIILLALVCTACGTALPTVKPYKLDIQQGNVVTSKMLLQLRPGMTKSQVRYVMGTPLIQDSFHGNRWDYAYQMRAGGKITERRRVILDFENELLKSVRGDVIPAGSDQSKAEQSDVQTGTRVVAPYKEPQKKGLIDKLKFWEKDEATLTKEKADKEAEAKVKVDPDLVEQNPEAASTQKIVLPVKVDEPKSILAVPIELTPEPEATKPVLPIEPIVKTAPPKATSEPVQPKAAEVAAKPAVAVAPADNKVPQPSDELPDEGELDYFDKLLEKIGF